MRKQKPQVVNEISRPNGQILGNVLRGNILKLVDEFYEITRKNIPDNKVPVTGKVYDANELKNLVESSLEGWWTDGKWCKLFEEKLKKYLGLPYVTLVNSGSSANLLALSSLKSAKLGKRQIIDGDEVITVAAGFPTTINPIIQLGLIPVFVDVDLKTCNLTTEDLGKALSKRTKAVMVAHTLGNPFDVNAVKRFCSENNLWFIEDNCDSLGSRYHGKLTGTFGDIATSSFYPAHHITTAEGGAVYTKDKLLAKIITSLRDWGRDCWCLTGHDNTCDKRFRWKLGNLPYGYDHKFTFSELGYNLKMTEMQAAIGVAQMDKLPGFVRKRRANFNYFHGLMREFEDYFILPGQESNTEPSWFGYVLTIRDDRIKRNVLLEFLARNNIATRLLFGGNIVRQPYFIEKGIQYRKVGALENSDTVMNNSFFVGIYPGLGQAQLKYMAGKFREFLSALPGNRI